MGRKDDDRLNKDKQMYRVDQRTSLHLVFDDKTLGISSRERRNYLRWHFCLIAILSLILTFILIRSYEFQDNYKIVIQK